VISIFAESNFFDEDTAFYPRLVELSQLRNRMNISNPKHMEPADEGDLFLERAKIEAEQPSEELVRQCASDFPREPSFRYVQPFRFP